MKRLRFDNWNPKPGEMAVVPGGPACRRYVSELTADECSAIVAGRGGYAPIRISVIDDNGDVLETFSFNERYNGWGNIHAGYSRNLSHLLGKVREYYRKPGAKLIAS